MPSSSLELLHQWHAPHPRKRCRQFWSILLNAFFGVFGKSTTEESSKTFLGRSSNSLTASPLKLHLGPSLLRSSLAFWWAISIGIGFPVSFTMLCVFYFFFFSSIFWPSQSLSLFLFPFLLIKLLFIKKKFVHTSSRNNFSNQIYMIKQGLYILLKTKKPLFSFSFHH